MKQKASSGHNIILFVGVLMVLLMFGALSIDMGYYFTTQNQLLTASESGALSGIHELFASDTGFSPAEAIQGAESTAQDMAGQNLAVIGLKEEQKDYEIVMGYMDSASGQFSDSPTADDNYLITGGYNAVKVNTFANDFSTLMAKIIGVDVMSSAASAIALAENSIGSMGSGVRPVYICKEQYERAAADGILENNTIRTYGQKFYIDGDTNLGDCPPPGEGNWGFADLRDSNAGAVGADTIESWFRDGYPGSVYANEHYSTQSGNFLTSQNVQSALQQLINNETIIYLPVIDNDYSGSGSNTSVNVIGFTAFIITNYNVTGPANSGHGHNTTDNRYIEGHFTKTICTKECTYTANAFGGSIGKVRLVSGS